MMDILGWVFLGLIGGGATYLTVTTDNDQLAIITGLIGGISWLLFAFYALDVGSLESGTSDVERYPAMVAYGLAMAAPNLYIALTGPLHMVRDRDRLVEEVR